MTRYLSKLRILPVWVPLGLGTAAIQANTDPIYCLLVILVAAILLDRLLAKR
jgi:hypothetical protein